MDVGIKFYTKNYPYRLIFKPLRLKLAENRFLASSDRPWQNNNFCLCKNISLKNVSKTFNQFSHFFLPQTVLWQKCNSLGNPLPSRIPKGPAEADSWGLKDSADEHRLPAGFLDPLKQHLYCLQSTTDERPGQYAPGRRCRMLL